MYTINNIRSKKNIKLAYDRLITNPESTYKNYFRNTYSNFALALDENVNNLSLKMKSGYLPEKSLRVYMPKANGLSRMYTLLTIEDQIVYQAYANIIANAITNKQVKSRYKRSVFGNLYTNPDSHFFYQPWQKSYKAYTGAIIRAYKSGLEYIASFDLTACYDSINHSLIKDILIKNHFSDNCASDFINLLSKWESADGFELGSGIPQGPQASGMIAEMVLSEYDAYVEKLQKTYKFKYFRYVDDIRILADNRDTVKWILFLLDKKSKELGLFPQSSKIDLHKIQDVNLEVKRISLPLFDDEFDDDKKSAISTKNISTLLRKKDADLSLIKRYFQHVKHNSHTNKISIKAVKQYPNLIHSFAFYVLRYPRKLPNSITDYIYSVCKDKTQQFAAGILLEASIDNLTHSDEIRFSNLAKSLLKEERKNIFITDCRFKIQLTLLVLLFGGLTDRQAQNLLNKDYNWWETKELIYKLSATENPIITKRLDVQLCNSNPDISLSAARVIIQKPSIIRLPHIHNISPVAQSTLKKAGIIQRSRYNNSQINRFILEITGKEVKIPWKKRLGKEHDPLERNMFSAVGYWRTDLTAFVNLWDAIDDRLCNELTYSYPELGGYVLGKIGGIKGSVKFKSILPHFYAMSIEVHELRLHSHLSHSIVITTNSYTGPIKQNERNRIKKLIIEAMEELSNFWCN